MALPVLAFFIATQDQFSIDVKKALSLINVAAEDIIIDMMNLCMDKIENYTDYVPGARHLYLRTLAFSVTLLDDESDERDITKRKGLKLDKLAKIFKTYPVVPLFGDIAIFLKTILVKAANVKNHKWDINFDTLNTQVASYSLKTHLETSRSHYQTELININIVRQIVTPKLTKMGRTNNDPAHDDAELLWDAISQSLKTLCLFSALVQEQVTLDLVRQLGNSCIRNQPLQL